LLPFLEHRADFSVSWSFTDGGTPWTSDQPVAILWLYEYIFFLENFVLGHEWVDEIHVHIFFNCTLHIYWGNNMTLKMWLYAVDHYQRFGGILCLHLQSSDISPARHHIPDDSNLGYPLQNLKFRIVSFLMWWLVCLSLIPLSQGTARYIITARLILIYLNRKVLLTWDFLLSLRNFRLPSQRIVWRQHVAWS
jgi:hypothetical protein